MDADEKILALKKAYADIILNISKEAANRVMASERRATLCQHETKMAKDECLRMLIRLKQMMDSKISQGEASSLSQQKKIAELEAQLHEAEDIVRDLREELSQAQTELDSVKNGDSLRENEMPLDITMMGYSYHPPSLQNRCNVAYGPKIPYLHRRQACHCKKLDCTCSLYIQNRDLPSIILRGKDSSLYRNGRTQRIRACERNGLDPETCLSGTTDELKKLKEDEHMPEFTEAASETDFASVELGSSQTFLCKRKRATRQRKAVRALVENPSMESQTLSSEKDVLNPITTEASEIENFVLGKSDHGRSDVDRDDMEFRSAEDPLNLSDTSPCRSAREREIKYTFQRKRNRSSQEGSEAKSLIQAETKESVKQDDGNESKKSKGCPSVDSTRECRRMAQVARQLLSLSERKWWD